MALVVSTEFGNEPGVAYSSRPRSTLANPMDESRPDPHRMSPQAQPCALPAGMPAAASDQEVFRW
jgi:hypothetical protein